MKTGEGGYWVQFDNDEEEKDFNIAVKKKASSIIGLLGSIILLKAENQNDNTIKQKTKKEN